MSHEVLLGLSSDQVRAARERCGWNDLPQPDHRSHWRLLLSVLTEPMVLLLILASVIYLVLGDAGDSLVLGFSVLLVVGLTLIQEWRSERALQALREIGSPRVRVHRDGQWLVLPARELVLGDLVNLSEGDRVPADLELLRADYLKVDESLLTGESVAVTKATESHCDSPDPVGDATLYAGTLAVAGNGLARVQQIGAATRMGQIGMSLSTVHAPATPLQTEIRRLVWLFGGMSILASLLMTLLYASLRQDWMQALLAGVTLAMSIIPEEFPVILTVFLALGAWQMARQHVLVRRAAAIEALGAVTVLCTDKTGTLTENRMVLSAWRPDDTQLVSDEALLDCAAAASNPVTHDPMDRAILAKVSSLDRATVPARAVLRRYPIGAVPVYAEARAGAAPDRHQIVCKGAPEVVLAWCKRSNVHTADWLSHIQAMANQGLRVLGVAEAAWPVDEPLPESLPDCDWRWRGLLGFADPLRGAVPAAVAEARQAGIRVLMLTGDHLDTATAIARQAGLSDAPKFALGQDVAHLDDAALVDLLSTVDGFARVRPEHKLRIVRALEAGGAVTAMTGDGVNDAPALQAATVGVAMGQRGTDVAREAAAIVLLDDDFSSIVRAVRLGRATYARIVQASRYVIAVHVPIVGLALLPLILGTPMILLPLHVVFLELIIDPASSIAFEREPVPADTMQKPPRARAGHLFRVSSLIGSVAMGSVVLTACVLAHLLAGLFDLSEPARNGLSFVALVAGNLALIYRFRAAATTFSALTTPNLVLHGVALVTMLGLSMLALNPTVAAWFGFAALPIWQFALGFLAPVLPVLAIDAWLRKRFKAADI